MEQEFIDRLHPVVLHAGMAQHHGDWNFKNVCSPFTRLYYVTEGQAWVEYPWGGVELRPNHLYLIPAFTRHGYACKGEFCHYYVHIYNDTDDNVLEDWVLPAEVEALHGDRTLVERLYTLCPGRELPAADPQAYDNRPMLLQNLNSGRQGRMEERMEERGIVLCLLARFFARAHPRRAGRDARVERALERLRAAIGSTPPPIGELAQETCLSTGHFIRLFRSEMGCTPLQYLIAKKMERAQERLLSGDEEVKEVAFSLGFDDVSYFNRLFRRATGTTPRAYRLFHHRFTPE